MASPHIIVHQYTDLIAMAARDAAYFAGTTPTASAPDPELKLTPPRETEAKDIKGCVIITGEGPDPAGGCGTPRIFMSKSDYEQFRVFFSYNMHLHPVRDKAMRQKMADKFWELYHSEKWETCGLASFRYTNIGEMITVDLFPARSIPQEFTDSEEEEEIINSTRFY